MIKYSFYISYTNTFHTFYGMEIQSIEASSEQLARMKAIAHFLDVGTKQNVTRIILCVERIA